MLDPVGRCEVLEPKAGLAVVTNGPLNPVGPQCLVGAGNIQQIPATIAILPFPGIGIAEVAPQGEAGDFVIKTNRVIAHTAGTRLSEFSVNPGDKLRFRYALGECLLRRDARHPHCRRVGQSVWRGLRVKR